VIKGLLARDEGKTLEFKRNCRPLAKIVQTAVAFANTAGGTLVIVIQDKTKNVLGLSDPLKDEERLARNTLFDEQPCSETSSEDIDFRAASEFFSSVSRQLTSPGRKSLGLLVNHGGSRDWSQGPEKDIYIE
jgi:predicted HTH transcriptional regulator